jgi:hypothetical protein
VVLDVREAETADPQWTDSEQEHECSRELRPGRHAVVVEDGCEPGSAVFIRDAAGHQVAAGWPGDGQAAAAAVGVGPVEEFGDQIRLGASHRPAIDIGLSESCEGYAALTGPGQKRGNGPEL